MRIQILLPLVLLGFQTLAQTTSTNSPSVTNSQAPSAELEKEHQWSFSLSGYTYIVPDSREYVQPTITADRGWAHLEARYNYEALDTCSA